MRRLLYGIMIFLLASGCSAPAGENDFDPTIRRDDVARVSLAEGIHQETIPAGDGRDLAFTLAVPARVQGERVPLVVALHYNDNATASELADIYLRTLAEPGLRDLGAIIFAPAVPGLTWTDPASEKAVMAFVEHALATWPIDPERVVVTGYSMGGVGTWFFTERRPDIFSAGIPMAGRPIGSLTSGVPLYVIHGSQDELFDVSENEQAVRALQAVGVNAEIVIVDGLGHQQATAYVAPLREAVLWLQESVWATN